MKHKPAIFALQRLHADLGGRIKDNKKEAGRLTESMKHVEAVLKLLEPGFNVARIAPRRRNRSNPLFKRGEIFREVLSLLRTTQGTPTTREIVETMLRKRGVTKPSATQIRSMVGAVHSSLRNHEGRSIETAGEGMPVRWRLIDGAR